MVNKYTFSYGNLNLQDYNASPEIVRNKQVVFSVDVDEEAQWEVPLRAFCEFLGSIYGYDIASQVLED